MPRLKEALDKYVVQQLPTSRGSMASMKFQSSSNFVFYNCLRDLARCSVMRALPRLLFVMSTVDVSKRCGSRTQMSPVGYTCYRSSSFGAPGQFGRNSDIQRPHLRLPCWACHQVGMPVIKRCAGREKRRGVFDHIESWKQVNWTKAKSYHWIVFPPIATVASA